MKKTLTLFFRMMIFAALYSLYSQAADDKTLFDVEIVVTGIKEKLGTIVISIHDSSESFRKRLPYRTAETAAGDSRLERDMMDSSSGWEARRCVLADEATPTL